MFFVLNVTKYSVLHSGLVQLYAKRTSILIALHFKILQKVQNKTSSRKVIVEHLNNGFFLEVVYRSEGGRPAFVNSWFHVN